MGMVGEVISDQPPFLAGCVDIVVSLIYAFQGNTGEDSHRHYQVKLDGDLYAQDRLAIDLRGDQT